MNFKDNIKILEWNPRGLRTKLDLQKYCDDYNVFVINESWLVPGSQFKLKNFKLIRFDREDDRTRGGIVIFIRDGLIFERVDTEV